MQGGSGMYLDIFVILIIAMVLIAIAVFMYAQLAQKKMPPKRPALGVGALKNDAHCHNCGSEIRW